MRRIALWVMSTVSGVVLLFSYHTSTDSGGATATGDSGTAGGTSSADPAPSSSSPSGTPDASGLSQPSPRGSASASSPSSPSSKSAKASSATHAYTGATADTRWGPVQVRITVHNGKITKSEAVVFPQDNPRDQEINSYAVPTLDHEVVAQQSARIDAVSGATVTSGGYLQSLQSAIDEAHL